MLVYGDRWRDVTPEVMIREVRRSLAAARAAPDGARRDLLTRALVVAGELAQGVADAEFEALGCDELTPAQEAAIDLTISVAARLLAAIGQPALHSPDPDVTLAALGSRRLPSRIRCKTPEGYAFYAIYPESYAAAAAGHPWPRPPLVIGVRSIGTSLAAIVAARVGGQAVTVRPSGHPFHRQLRVSQRLRDRLIRHDGPFVVVDEGPGLSGSSFGAVGDLLESLGAADRLVFMPSHDGDLNPRAAPSHRALWARATRLKAGCAVSEDAIKAWFDDVAGPASTVEDLSGGSWRRDLPEVEWPPAAPVTERRKYRLSTPSGRYLARFAGLGAIGERKLATARRLHAAGFTPEPLALRRGFLLERWVDGERLRPADWHRPPTLAHLGRYLGFRARALPAMDDGGTPVSLREMARTNVAQLGGPELGDAIAGRLAGIEDLTGLAPVRIDGRPHAWEWLRLRDGRLCKTDALDHAAAHDLVGCQDIAWDVAGAAVELGLSEQTTEELRRTVSAAAERMVNPQAVSAYRICYAAFQAGAWSMACDCAPSERGRVQAKLDGYLDLLRRAVVPAAIPADILPGPRSRRQFHDSES